MRFSFVAAMLAIATFNTAMAAPINARDNSEVIRTEEHQVAKVTTSTALEPASHGSHETQTHEDRPQIVRRVLTAAQHRDEAAAHNRQASIHTANAQDNRARVAENTPGSKMWNHYENLARTSTHLANYHTHTANAHTSEALALEQPHNAQAHLDNAAQSRQSAANSLANAHSLTGQQ
ncbi:hypothetical protein FRC14_004807 [Serendipita sp. 396]|nr:hypothetical protein FRC14_004807 [Serendipita sp. 396]KAG8789313.1 hypothetical protein FRC15_009365 [Serendipita sp. 397]KAG8804548.1 hypothetical protein FRC16_005990 [Serendipita sp. 398]KAG8819676.1 hypothetical protein FRC19_009618 [Serendipita sp. 401]KAG8821941.1 hypothetical protein FRC18_011162 [Serendipita sp. 400]KAG8849202.1 hypothetical protein FRB91_010190 [Serendipita sp. 411]KAG8878667.1 hypothetical protein FRC20_006344 [Serendipita sp. 405]KAG9052521.1 hypothetical prot